MALAASLEDFRRTKALRCSAAVQAWEEKTDVGRRREWDSYSSLVVALV
jgi:hypothetical protein